MCRQKRLQPQTPIRPHPQPLHPPQCLPPSNLHNSFLFSSLSPSSRTFPVAIRTLNSVLETSSYRRFECLSRSHQSQSARFSILFKRLLIFVSSCRSIIHMYILYIQLFISSTCSYSWCITDNNDLPYYIYSVAELNSFLCLTLFENRKKWVYFSDIFIYKYSNWISLLCDK